MICTRLRSGHLTVRVGDGLRRSEEIVKKIRIAPLNTIYDILLYYFDLPMFVKCPIYRNINDEECLPLVSV